MRLPSSLHPAVRALTRVVCTDEVDRLGLMEDVVEHLGLSIQSMPPHIRFGLIAGLTAFELGAAAHPRHLGRPFSRLSRAHQEAWFKAWWDSPALPVRQLLKGLKGLVALAYWDHPTVLARLGYRPDAWIAEVSARRQRDYADDISAHDRLVVAPDRLVPAGRARGTQAARP